MIVIEYLHFNNYIYRDLKPDNVIIDDDKNAFLIDLDRMIKNSSQNEEKDHTRDFFFDFQAPELALNKFTNKVDIFSIGKIIKFMFSDEFTSGNKSEYLTLKALSEECYSDDADKRPNISQLIDRFYLDFYSMENPVDESDTIKTNENIHNDSFFPYWFLLSEIQQPESKYQLGLLYEEGKIVPKNINKAWNYYRIAADEDILEAQYKFGSFLINNKDCTDEDVFKAIHYFTKAAEKNHCESQFSLGMIYYDFINVCDDINKAVHYITLAANQNHKEAQYFLGRIYHCNFVGYPTDINRSIYYYKLAAMQNNDYIEKIFENGHQHDEEYYDDMLFYEQIEFSSLSQEKLNEFLSKLDIGKITGGLWSKLLSALTHQKDNTKNERYQLNNNNKKFKYDTNRQNRFEGIIHHLNNQCHGNSAEKGVIDVSIPDMPTIYNFSTHKNSNVVDLKDKMSYVTSKKEYSNWLKIDFKEKRVRPNNYSIRTWHLGPGNSHLMNWAVE